MASVDDILAAMRNNPKNVSYADACKVADNYFGSPRQSGSSHRVWKMPWAGNPRVNLQQGSGGKAKAYQVEQLLAAIDKLVASQSPPKAPPDETPPEDPPDEKPPEAPQEKLARLK